MGRTYELRRATEADIEALLAFWHESAENTDRYDDHESVAALLRHDPQALILAVAGGAIIGSVIAAWDGWRCHLYRVAVHSSWRRQGVARRLVAESEHRAAGLGARRVSALVLEGNQLGRSAWRALGYRHQPEWQRWVKSLDEVRSQPPG